VTAAHLITAITGFLMLLQTCPKFFGGISEVWGGKFPRLPQKVPR